MPRTKRRFDEREQDSSNTNVLADTEDNHSSAQEPTAFPRSSFGGGKQLRPMSGGGKQIRIQAEEDDSDDDNSSENDEDMLDTQPTTSYNRPSPIGGGKQFRPSGGKQFHHVAEPEESEESSDDDNDDESEPEPIVYNRGTGKSLQRMGKQLRRPMEAEALGSEKDQDEQEETSEPIRLTHNPRGGKILRPFNPSPEDSMSIDDSEEEEDVAPPTTKRSTRTTTRARTVQKKLEVDDMEESSEESSDDDFDSEEEQELDMETFNYNQLIEDEADQKMLDSLPEIERESILAERFERFKNAADMKKALRENKRQERERKRLESGKKGKVSKGKKVAKKGAKANKKDDTSKDAQIAEDLAFGRAAKNKDVTGVKAKRKAALEQLRKDRAEATNKNDDEESDLDYGDDNDDDSDDDEEYAEEVKPWQKKKKSSRLASLPVEEEDVSDDNERQEDRRRVTKVFVEADTTDYAKVTIPRRRLIRWCNEPFFEQAVSNFYVRVAIGRDKLTQRPCYRLCKIVGIVSKKEQYTIDDQSNQYPKPGGATGKLTETNKYLNVSFGDSVKLFKISYISDTSPNEEEVRAHVSQLKNRRETNLLSKKDATKMRKMQDELVNNYTYTAEDIQRAVEEKKSLSKKISNIGADKTRTLIAVSAAQALYEETKKEKDDLENKLFEANEMEEEDIKEQIEALQSKLVELMDDLEKKQKEHKKILDAEASRIRRIQNSEKVRNWAIVNERAKAANKAADQEAYKNEKGTQESSSKDLYARRKVKPQILWEVGQKMDEEKETDATKGKVERNKAEEAARDDSNNVSENIDTREANNGRKIKLADQINDLAIEEETLTSGLNGMIGKKSTATRVRKGLSIQEYLERKAAGTL